MRQIDGQVAALDRGNARSSSSSCNVVEDDRRQAPPKAIRQDLEAEEEEEEDEWQTTADATSDDYSHQQAGSEQFAIEYEVEYDSNGQARRVKRQIEPLAPVDHSGLEYGAFKKCFFDLPQELRGLSREEIDALRREIDVTVSDSSAPPPCSDFQQLKFGEKIENIIKKLDYKCPTPIQAQSLPILLSGMNLIGIAETGSGKTAAYVWPMIIHIKRSELAGLSINNNIIQSISTLFNQLGQDYVF
ncbi:MAG: ATP-dependent RNA helicase ddx42 [Marteilia pararefringens]